MRNYFNRNDEKKLIRRKDEKYVYFSHNFRMYLIVAINRLEWRSLWKHAYTLNAITECKLKKINNQIFSLENFLKTVLSSFKCTNPSVVNWGLEKFPKNKITINTTWLTSPASITIAITILWAWTNSKAVSGI